MAETKLSRRTALQVLGSAPLLTVLLTACGKDEPDSCSDVSGLNDPEKTARSALQYTDRSPEAAKQCRNCNQYQPAPTPSQCGGCQIVKGPIHPNGYCTAWAQKV